MRSVRRSGYATLRCLLLVAVGAVAPSAFAQPLQQSHRILELPKGGMSDLEQQLQTLRRLQSLVGGQKDQPPEVSRIDPGQLNQLQQMIKQFGGELPKNLLPWLNSVPPSVVQDVLSDPEARQQIQQLLKQYAKDRQLPRGDPGSKMPLLPPSEEDNLPNFRLPNRATGEPSSPTDDEQQPPKPGRDVDRSNAGLKNALEGVMKRYSDLQQTENQSSADQPSGTPANPRAAGDGNMKNSWSDMLDRMIEHDRKFREGNSTEAGKDRHSASASAGNGQTGSMNDGSGKNAPSKTVAEYLEELKNQPLPSVQEEPPASPPTSPQTPRSVGRPNDISSQQPSVPDKSAVAREQLKQNTKSSLQRRGLTETLRRIARDARQQVSSSGGAPGDAAPRSQAGAKSGSSSGFERALFRALDGVREDIVEIAKDAKFKPSRSGNESSTTGRDPTGRSGSDSGMRSFGRSAGNFLNELAAPASTTDSSSSATVGINDAVTENIFGLLSLLVLLGIVALFAWKSGLLAPPFGEPAYAPPMRAADIRTKEDVVNAFHRMALQPSRQVQQWWTHRKAADRMFQDRPEYNRAMELLTELYEQARYLPEETAFSQEQIQSARQALKQCESC